jgi:2-hydroxychromene-2-carboxylate isomerase
MAEPRVEFLFDFLSPYAYLAWVRLPELRAGRSFSLSLRPVALGAVLRHWGQLGPAQIPPKALFTFKDCVRRAQRLGCAFRAPAVHPFNPLPALRVSLPEVAGDAQLLVVGALWRAAWAEGRDLGSPEVIVDALNRAGLDGASLLARTNDPEVKASLKTNGDRAIDEGVFGVPTFLVGGELFWGEDQIPLIAQHLDGKDPLNGISLADLAPGGAGSG